MTDDRWTDCTVFGSAFEEQMSESGACRHRRSQTHGRVYDEWKPGPAPVTGLRRPEPTPEEIAHLLKVNPMRMLSRLNCGDCGHEWQQPSNTGNCPRCHGSNTACYKQVPLVLRKA